MPDGLLIKQSTATVNIPFYLVLSADHVTPATGLVPVVTLSKNCGAFAAASGAVTELASGWYKLAANATDSNTLGALVLKATIATADNAHDTHHVVAFDTQDAVRGASGTALPNAVAAAAGGLIILGSNNTAAITIGALTTGAISATTFATSGAMTLNALTVSNNLLISGTTTHTGAVTLSNNFTVVGTTNHVGVTTFTGNIALADGFTIAVPSTANRAGFTTAGNGTGPGIMSTGGTTGHGAYFLGGSTTLSGCHGILAQSGTGVDNEGSGICALASPTSNGNGILFSKDGTGYGLLMSGIARFQNGVRIQQGTADTPGLYISGNGTGEAVSMIGAVTATGALTAGATTLSSLTITNNLLISGNSTVTGTTTHTGAVSFGSTFGVTGAITATNASNNIKGVDVTRWLGTTVSTPTVAGVPNVNAKTWNDLATVALPLTPTTAGRTLDVSATGEGGLDWANVGTPGATVNLSNTRIALVDLVTTVTNNPNAGNGAYTVQATVTDGTNPLAQATLRVTSGINTFSTVTDASGHAQFSLDAGTYTVSATKGGYSFTPSTRTVTGNNAGTLYTSPIAMTAVVVPVNPTDPSLCTVYGHARNQATNALMPNVEVIATREPGGLGYAGGVLVGREIRTRTDTNGLYQLNITRTDYITNPTNAKWRITCKAAGINVAPRAFAVATYNLDTLLATP
jgi:hypothetical protein